jgi:hypothetical protein
MRRYILAACAIGSTCVSAALVLDGCATGGLIEGQPEAGEKDVTTTGNDAANSDGGCKAGQTDCNGTCVNTASDPKNCGKCGTACSDGGVCSQSACATTCGGGTTKCGSSCVNVQTDPQNCGKCATACAGNDFCDGGACIPSCTTAQKLCDDGGLFCANVQTDNANCGDCNVACLTSWTCTQAKCLPNCTTGQTLCDIDGGTQGDGGPFCTDTKVDPNNCGQCDKACTTSQYCDAGACVTNVIPSACKTVNSVLWCYHPNNCGEGCNTVCTAAGKTAIADASVVLAAQNTQTLCQNIATAFGNVSTPNVGSYAYACAEVAGFGDGGAVTGQFYCSTDIGCPTSHLTTSDQQGVVCSGTNPFTGICACK